MVLVIRDLARGNLMVDKERKTPVNVSPGQGQ